MDINESALKMAEKVRAFIRKDRGLYSDVDVDFYWNSLSEWEKVNLFHIALDA